MKAESLDEGLPPTSTPLQVTGDDLAGSPSRGGNHPRVDEPWPYGQAAIDRPLRFQGLRDFNTALDIRAYELEVLRHRNCPAFLVTRTPEGLKIDCPSHEGD